MTLDICPMCYSRVVVNCQDITFKHKEQRIACQKYISYQCQQCDMEFVKVGENEECEAKLQNTIKEEGATHV